MAAARAEHVETHEVEVDLVAGKLAGHLLHWLVRAAPAKLGVVEDGDACDVRAAAQKVAHPVGVAHELLEVRELRVVAARVEVRRAVGVG